MNANNGKCLGENTYKRNYSWERKRRIVVNVEEETPVPVDFNKAIYEWRPYPNLPIAPGLPDFVLDCYHLGDTPTRSTCADTMDEEEIDVSFDLSKYDETNEELDDDGLNGIDTSFADFEYRKYMGETFDENYWNDEDIDDCSE